MREAVGMSNRKDEPDNGPLRVDVDQLHRISELTIAHYDRLAEAYWDSTRDHDVNWKIATATPADRAGIVLWLPAPGASDHG